MVINNLNRTVQSVFFFPEIPLNVGNLNVLPIQPIVRGYAAQTKAIFTVTNIHPSFKVMSPLRNGTNFNYTIYLDDDSAMANNLSDTAAGLFLPVCNATAVALAPNTSIVVGCELDLIVPREECWQFSRLCARVAPSKDGSASYTEHNYINALTCIHISALKNCPGK